MLKTVIAAAGGRGASADAEHAGICERAALVGGGEHVGMIERRDLAG
jgi:hypothetical protein